MGALMTAVVLALSVGSVAYTIAQTKITRPLHVWVAGRDGAAWRWLGSLIGCPYCLAHWLAFGATAIYRPWLVEVWRPIDFAVTSMAIVAASMLPVLVIKRALASAAPNPPKIERILAARETEPIPGWPR